MKHIRLIICFSIFSLLVHTASADSTVHISTGEFPPWSSESLKHKGFTNHVISEAFKLEGYDVEFTFYPWKRAYDSAKSGDRFQATSYWYPSDERAAEFHYSDPIQEDAVVFFHLKENPIPEWETLEDLNGKVIGATSGYTYTAEFWEAAESGRIEVEKAASDELNFKKLLKGRIDLFPSDPLVGQKLLNELFGPEVADKVTYSPKPLIAPSGHLLVSKELKNAQKLISDFNKGLQKLKESGQYAEFQKNLIAGKYEQ